MFSGVNAACVPYAPGNNAHNSGNGYWMATDQSHVYTFGAAHFYGDPSHAAPQQAVDRRRGDARTTSGYWLLGLDGGIFTFGDAKFYGSTGGRHLNQPINGMERTVDDQGYWLVAVRRRHLHLRRREVLRLDRRQAPEPARARHGAHGVGQGLLAVRPRRRRVHASATRSSTARPAACTSRRRSSRCSARTTATATGCSPRTGTVYRFGDAGSFGGIAGCTQLRRREAVCS